jgi:REP element-mobilizing transposase RayT
LNCCLEPLKLPPKELKFRELLVSYAGFSGITVAAWCLMDNHFHLLLHVPSREQTDPSLLPEK